MRIPIFGSSPDLFEGRPVDKDIVRVRREAIELDVSEALSVVRMPASQCALRSLKGHGCILPLVRQRTAPARLATAQKSPLGSMRADGAVSHRN
jgi:hypothetical protein